MTSKISNSRRRIAVTTLVLALAGSFSVGYTTADDDLGQVLADELATPVGCVHVGESNSGIVEYHTPVGGTSCASGQGACQDVALTYERPLEQVLDIRDTGGFDCSSGTANCEGNSWFGTRTWEVSGSHNGTGNVHFYVQCGDSKPAIDRGIICDTVSQGFCQDGPEGDDGDFGCFYEIQRQPVLDVVGECVDPLNPGIIYPALDAVNHTVYNVFEHALPG